MQRGLLSALPPPSRAAPPVSASGGAAAPRSPAAISLLHLGSLPTSVACGCAIAAVAAFDRAGSPESLLHLTCDLGPSLEAVRDVLRDQCGRQMRVEPQGKALVFVAELV